ncbi:MFS transporter [Streptomyces sp. NPDC058691]|uniref:MFS transporter n=1 Tax=Streptomyces sp. NPDC058691 TaxID=3346601 RepID=UPI003663E13A
MKDIPKVVWLLATGMFFVAAVSFTFVYLFVYLTGPRGLSTSQAGLIAGAGGIGMVAGNFTGGWFGDRFGHRRTLITGMVVSGLGLASLPVLPTGALAIVFPLAQYGTGITRASNSALIAFSVPEGSRRQGFALLRFMANLGVTIGPPLGALIATTTSYGWLFVADGLGMLAFGVYAHFILPANGNHREKTRAPADAPGLWAALRARPAVLLLLVAILVADTIYRQQYSTLPVFLSDHGIGTGVYGALIAINGGLVILFELPVTVALRRRAPLPIIALGMVLVGAGFGVLSAGRWYIATAVVMMILLTVGDILYKSPSTAYVADNAPDHLQGRFQSMYAGASISGVVLAAPLGGVLYESAPGALWPLCAVLGIAAGVVVYCAHRLPGERAAAAEPDAVTATSQS